MKVNSRPRSSAGQSGILIVEMVVAMGVLAIVLSSAIGGLLVANRNAAANRALTAARLVVERNVERALSASYSSNTTPAILGSTPSDGAVWDDDGGGDNLVEILVQNATGTVTHLQGTLRRIVSVESTPNSADVRRITFRLNFAYLGRSLTSEMTTLRAVDDF